MDDLKFKNLKEVIKMKLKLNEDYKDYQFESDSLYTIELLKEARELFSSMIDAEFYGEQHLDEGRIEEVEQNCHGLALHELEDILSDIEIAIRISDNYYALKDAVEEPVPEDTVLMAETFSLENAIDYHVDDVWTEAQIALNQVAPYNTTFRANYSGIFGFWSCS
ncbi:MAG: hypothetical protein ACLFT6_07150 [Bacteroidales bacterium]